MVCSFLGTVVRRQSPFRLAFPTFRGIPDAICGTSLEK